MLAVRDTAENITKIKINTKKLPMVLRQRNWTWQSLSRMSRQASS